MTEIDKKRVTFALFAYNQEKYIRQAIEGAFSQTYEPLEIILSDDYSSDKTFEIIDEMAAKYVGPHRVIARQSQSNRGLVKHIRDVVEISTGHIVVVAAGDDISFSQRTTALVSLIEKEGSEFAASNYCHIGVDGEIKDESISNDYSTNYICKVINADPNYFANGATAAYKKSFLVSAFASASDTVNRGNIYNEDVFFAAYAVATNSFPSNYNKDPLIAYRINASSLSNFSVAGNTFKDELSLVYREKFRSSTQLATLNAIQEIAVNHPNILERLKDERIRRDIRRCETEINSFNSKFTQRLKHLIKVRNIKELRIISARLFGCRFLAGLRVCKKSILRYIEI